MMYQNYGQCPSCGRCNHCGRGGFQLGQLSQLGQIGSGGLGIGTSNIQGAGQGQANPLCQDAGQNAGLGNLSGYPAKPSGEA